jgi:hypothetical protein
VNEPEGLCRGVGAWIALCISRSGRTGMVRMPSTVQCGFALPVQAPPEVARGS